jgi:Zn-finger nucleic acid-binding protein
MICPFDATQLQVVNRSGVDIDWCPSCKGVWLERGELDKLIDLAAGTAAPAPTPMFAAPAPGAALPAPPARSRRDWDDDDDDDDDDWGRGHPDGRRKKRKNLLAEIFDF